MIEYVIYRLMLLLLMIIGAYTLVAAHLHR